MKINKKIIMLLLTALVISGNIVARGGGGHGGGGHGGGHGYHGGGHGYGHGGHWGGRGYGWGGGYGWRGGYWGPGWGWGAPLATGVVIGAAAASGSSDEDNRGNAYLDNMNLRYWSVENNTGMPIRVKTPGYGYLVINPGAKRSIQRGYSFKIAVEAHNGLKLRFATQDHFIRIKSRGRGLSFESWNKE